MGDFSSEQQWYVYPRVRELDDENNMNSERKIAICILHAASASQLWLMHSVLQLANIGVPSHVL